LTNALTRGEFDADPDQAVSGSAGNYQIDVDTARLANRTVWRIDDERSLEFGLSLEEQSLFHPIVWSPFFSLLIDRDHRDAGSMARYRQAFGDHELVVGLNHGDSEVSGGHYSHIAAQPTDLWAQIETSASTTELFALDRWAVSDQTTLVLAVQAVSADREAMTTPVPSGPVNHPAATYDHINPRIGRRINTLRHGDLHDVIRIRIVVDIDVDAFRCRRSREGRADDLLDCLVGGRDGLAPELHIGHRPEVRGAEIERGDQHQRDQHQHDHADDQRSALLARGVAWAHGDSLRPEILGSRTVVMNTCRWNASLNAGTAVVPS
jgi:hypothetical protein